MAQTFDEAELLERVDNDVEFLAETVEMLAADGPALLDQIRQAISFGDAAAVGKHAHALKGMISNFCAAQAQDAALGLEKAGKAGDLSRATELLESVEVQVNALSEELAGFVKAKT